MQNLHKILNNILKNITKIVEAYVVRTSSSLSLEAFLGAEWLTPSAAALVVAVLIVSPCQLHLTGRAISSISLCLDLSCSIFNLLFASDEQVKGFAHHPRLLSTREKISTSLVGNSSKADSLLSTINLSYTIKSNIMRQI